MEVGTHAELLQLKGYYFSLVSAHALPFECAAAMLMRRRVSVLTKLQVSRQMEPDELIELAKPA